MEYTREWVMPACGCELKSGHEDILYIRRCPKHEAAPDLYEALKLVAASFNYGTSAFIAAMHKNKDKIDKVLAKVEGGK